MKEGIYKSQSGILMVATQPIPGGSIVVMPLQIALKGREAQARNEQCTLQQNGKDNDNDPHIWSGIDFETLQNVQEKENCDIIDTMAMLGLYTFPDVHIKISGEK